MNENNQKTCGFPNLSLAGKRSKVKRLELNSI